jgi:hypothetical protein
MLTVLDKMQVTPEVPEAAAFSRMDVRELSRLLSQEK